MRVTPSCDTINSLYISNAVGVQQNPDIAFGGGNYFTIWSDTRYSYYYIYGARITTNGINLDPNGIPISALDNNYYYYPTLIFNGTTFFVLWSTSTIPCRIIGRFINTNGSYASDTFTVFSSASYIYETKIAYSGSNYFLAWNEYNQTTYTYTARGCILSTSGTPIGAPFTIADSVAYNSLAVRFAGSNYLITTSKQIGSLNQIIGRYYNTAGQPVGSLFNISNTPYHCYAGDLYLGANNRFLNVWQEYRTNNYDIYGNIDIQVGINEYKKEIPDSKQNPPIIVSNSIILPNKNAKGTIYNIAGRIIANFQNGYCDCSQWNPGIYFLVCKNNEYYRIIKIK